MKLQHSWHRVRMTGSLLLLITSIGCGGGGSAEEEDPAELARQLAASDTSTISVTPEQLRQKLRTNELATFLRAGSDIVEANLFRSGAKTVEPLRGLPLTALDLGHTQVSDLSPLAEMKLKTLILESTPVSDISVIKGMPLEVLKLQKTKVTDFSVLAGLPLKQLNLLSLPFSDLSLVKDMPLEILWLAGTQVTSLEGIPTAKLVSLDIDDTQIADLTPIAAVPTLRRLSLARTPVTDVSPLKDLKLERIVLSPERITSGMEVLRSMKSLVQIQLSVEEEQSAEDFWKRYDLGVWKAAETNP